MTSCSSFVFAEPKAFSARSRRGSPPTLLMVILAWTGISLLMARVSIVDAALPQKSGACPPPTNVEVCVYTCYEDYDCRGNDKCCKTLCGGSMCTRSVTPPRYKPRNETGWCPDVSVTPWVCGNRCSVDEDCGLGKKCCMHRCGGYSCLRAVAQPPRNSEPSVVPRYPSWG